jgi:hypothetical protein
MRVKLAICRLAKMCAREKKPQPRNNYNTYIYNTYICPRGDIL